MRLRDYQLGAERRPVGALSQRLKHARQGFVLDFPGDVLGDRRCGDGPPPRRGVGEKRRGELGANISKGLSVESHKGRPVMAPAQECQRFLERAGPPALGFPFSRCRRLSLLIKAVLRAASLTRCSVEAEDRLPTPVLEKSGSGLEW
jgi:hypothetical protein